jgi:hypothetical protein
MSSNPRPVLLGYIRADVLRSAAKLRRVQAQLANFAHREVFSLGTVYVEKGASGGVFHSLMDELVRDDAAWGVVVPDLRHLTVVEQLILRTRGDASRTPLLIADHSRGHLT